MQGPACSRVTGTTCPSGRNTCVIPIFLPRIPGLISKLQGPGVKGQGPDLLRSALPTHIGPTNSNHYFQLPSATASAASPTSGPRSLAPHSASSLAECLNLYVHTSRQIQLHQRVHCLLRGFQNVEQTFVRSDFKL